MNWIDIIVILALGGGAFLGFKSGFIWQLSRLILLIISVYATFLMHRPLASWLTAKMSNPFLAQLIIFIFIFAVIYLILFFITLFIEKAVSKIKLKKVDSILGAILGFLKAALVFGTVLLALVLYPGLGIQSSLRNSFFTTYLLGYTKKAVFLMPKDYRRKVTHFIKQTDAIKKTNQENIR